MLQHSCRSQVLRPLALGTVGVCYSSHPESETLGLEDLRVLYNFSSNLACRFSSLTSYSLLLTFQSQVSALFAHLSHPSTLFLCLVLQNCWNVASAAFTPWPVDGSAVTATGVLLPLPSPPFYCLCYCVPLLTCSASITNRKISL